MEIRTEVQKTHFITMDDTDMSTLMEMLSKYKRYIADKMPDGMSDPEREIFSMFYRAQTGTVYYDARSFEPPVMPVQTAVPQGMPRAEAEHYRVD